jgi:hypothetical protein
VSGLAVHSTIRAVGAAVTEPRSQRTNSRTTAAGRATCVFDTRSNIWIGWQMLTVNSGWLGPNAMPTPAVNGRLASVMRTARTELRARRSDFESNCLTAPRRSLCRTALARVQAPSQKRKGPFMERPLKGPAENENGTGILVTLLPQRERVRFLEVFATSRKPRSVENYRSAVRPAP